MKSVQKEMACPIKSQTYVFMIIYNHKEKKVGENRWQTYDYIFELTARPTPWPQSLIHLSSRVADADGRQVQHSAHIFTVRKNLPYNNIVNISKRIFLYDCNIMFIYFKKRI